MKLASESSMNAAKPRKLPREKEARTFLRQGRSMHLVCDIDQEVRPQGGAHLFLMQAESGKHSI